MNGIWGHRSPPVVREEREVYDADVLVVGSGAGGATTAWALASTGARVLVVERGDFLPREPQNRSPEAVFVQGRYHNTGTWHTDTGRPFTSGGFYGVGGTTKVYGAALPRLRASDFHTVEHLQGTSPAWPFTYADLEPYYAEAERLYRVHGADGDPTGPPRSTPFPWPAVPHEPVIGELAGRLAGQGLRPFPLELGIDLAPRGACERCGTCDAYPCRVGAKSDAETRALRPALRTPAVRLLTRTRVTRVRTDGRQVTSLDAVRDGRPVRLRAGTVVLSCGAVNSALLLLRSGGLGNGSGLVGRNLMLHNNSVLMAVDPRRRNPVVFQKTLAVNDFYLPGPGRPPLGTLQLMGKVYGPTLASSQPWLPRRLLGALTARSVDWWVMSEDLPDPENRVLPGAGPDGVTVRWRPTNTGAHRQLVCEARRMMRRAGYPLVFARQLGVEATGHQCGTTVAGDDPARSVLDPYCRSHEVANLFVVDGGFFPSSAAVNPTLTIAAQALRVVREGGVLP